MVKLGRLLSWSLAFTLCLSSFSALSAPVPVPAQVTPPVQPASPVQATPPAPTAATGENWVPASSEAATASANVNTTTTAGMGGRVAATPPSAPTPAYQGTSTAPNDDAAADADPEALTMFNADLAPYGQWIDDPRYGRIWVPNRNVVGTGFSPYVTAGHWALDGDDNWVWASDYPFGDIVFHYGRWFYAADYGWAWVPGRTYAPSWVVWRTPTNSSYAYTGWAPMPPRFGWYSSGIVWYSAMPPVSYVFCPSDYLFYPSVGLYVVHDPWLVGRLGIYTSFYYPPYGYYGWGYYGHGYGGMGYYNTHNYGPPVYRTGISQRAIPRERVAASPSVARLGTSSPRGAVTSSGRIGATPGVSALRRSTSLGTSSWTAPRTSPLVRTSSTPAGGPRAMSAPRSAAQGFSPRSASPLTSPRSSGMGSWSAPRSTGFSSSPRSTSTFGSSPRSTSTFSSSPRSTSSFGSAPSFRSSPSFHSSPSFGSSPSFRSSGSSPSFRGGGRHR